MNFEDQIKEQSEHRFLVERKTIVNEEMAAEKNYVTQKEIVEKALGKPVAPQRELEPY